MGGEMLRFAQHDTLKGLVRTTMAINVILALMIVGSFLLAIVLHESGHALMASVLGDPTPRVEGRQSFSLAIGLLFALLLRFIFGLPFLSQISSPVLLWLVTHFLQLLTVFASVNICLALFNVLPFYPLDGYQIVYTLLPTRQAVQFAKSAPYGPFIVLGIFFLLPFLAQISGSGLSGLFIFHIPTYLLEGSLALIGLVSGQPLVAVGIHYFLP